MDGTISLVRRGGCEVNAMPCMYVVVVVVVVVSLCKRRTLPSSVDSIARDEAGDEASAEAWLDKGEEGRSLLRTKGFIQVGIVMTVMMMKIGPGTGKIMIR